MKCAYVSLPAIYPVLPKAVSDGVLSLSSDLQTPADAQGSAAQHPCTDPDHKTHFASMEMYIHSQPIHKDKERQNYFFANTIENVMEQRPASVRNVLCYASVSP